MSSPPAIVATPLEVGVLAYLLGQPSVAALVAARIYGLMRPVAAVLPNVTLQRATTQRQVLFCGTDRLVDCGMQVDCFSTSGEEAWGVARAMRLLLRDFTGFMGGTYVDHCTLTNEFPMIDPDPGVIRVTQLYSIWYVED